MVNHKFTFYPLATNEELGTLHGGAGLMIHNALIIPSQVAYSIATKQFGSPNGDTYVDKIDWEYIFKVQDGVYLAMYSFKGALSFGYRTQSPDEKPKSIHTESGKLLSDWIEAQYKIFLKDTKSANQIGMSFYNTFRYLDRSRNFLLEIISKYEKDLQIEPKSRKTVKNGSVMISNGKYRDLEEKINSLLLSYFFTSYATTESLINTIYHVLASNRLRSQNIDNYLKTTSLEFKLRNLDIFCYCFIKPINEEVIASVNNLITLRNNLFHGNVPKSPRHKIALHEEGYIFGISDNKPSTMLKIDRATIKVITRTYKLLIKELFLSLKVDIRWKMLYLLESSNIEFWFQDKDQLEVTMTWDDAQEPWNTIEPLEEEVQKIINFECNEKA